MHNLWLIYFFILMSPQVWASCLSPEAPIGARNYNTSTQTYQMCTTEGWLDFYTQDSAGSCPVESTGTMNYNTTDSLYEYCDGVNWTQLGLSESGNSCEVTSMDYVTRVVDSTNLGSAITVRVHPDGDKVIVGGQWSSRLSIYDVSNPTSPSFAGTVSNSNLANSYDFVVSGSHVYAVGASNNNMVVVDISNPSSPSYVTRVQSSPTDQMNNIWSIDKSADGSHVFTVSWNSGGGACWLHSINITDPENPSVVAAFNVSSASSSSEFCERVRVHNNYAYVSFPGGGRLVRLDVSDPTNPTYLSHDSNSDAENQRSLALDFKGEYAYSTTDNGRFNAWDISEPHPTSVSHLASFTDSTAIGVSYSVEVKGNYAFVSRFNGTRFSAVDISDPANPTVVTTLNNSNLVEPGQPAIIGQYAYVPLYGDNGLAVVDLGCEVQDLSGPVNLGACTTESSIDYFSEDEVLAWCDGSEWRALASTYTPSEGEGEGEGGAGGPPPVGAEVSVEQSASGAVVDNVVTASFPAPPTDGNLLVAMVGHRGDDMPEEMTSSGWDMPVYFRAYTGQSNERHGLAIYTKVAGPSEPQLVEGPFTFNGTARIVIAEVSTTEGTWGSVEDSAYNIGPETTITTIGTGSANANSEVSLVISGLIARDNTGAAAWDQTEGQGASLEDGVSIYANFHTETSSGSKSNTATWPNARIASAAVVTVGIEAGPPPADEIVIVAETATGGGGRNVTLPFYGSVDVTIDWGDETANSSCTTEVTSAGEVTCQMPAENTEYTIKVAGTLTGFGAEGAPYSNVARLKRVDSWGNVGLTGLVGAFRDAPNIESVASPPPTVTNLDYMFMDASHFNGDVGGWDVSSIETMRYMFDGATSFNQDLDFWDTGNVTNMEGLFFMASDFDGNITSWDTSQVQNTDWMFWGASAFSQDIGFWNTGSLVDAEGMFGETTSFNQNLTCWDVQLIPSEPDDFRTNSALIADNRPLWGTDGSAGTCSGSSQWTPLELGSKLVAWYDPSDSSTLTMNGSRIDTLEDKSGNGLNLGHASGGPETEDGGEISTGKTTIKLDNDGFLNNFSFSGSWPLSFFFIANKEGTNSSAPIVIQQNSDPWPTYNYYQSDGEAGVWAFGQNRAWTNSGVAAVQIVSVVATTNQLELFLNGELGDSSSGAFNEPFNPDYLSLPENWQGNLGGVVITSGVLTTAERQKVEGYIAHSWDRADLLPSGHPYKDDPPEID